MNTKYIDLIEQTFDFPQEEFKTINHKLFWHGINLMELAEKYGAPLKFTYLPKISENIQKAKASGKRYLPHEYMYKLLLSGVLEQYYEIDIKDSWMYAAAEKNLPMVVPGWEDSTMGNIFASYVLKGELVASTIKSGIEYMTFLSDWYTNNSKNGIGFFQIGGGIAGDFPICVVPMLYQDMERIDTLFGVIFVKFQIQQRVMGLILAQFLTKKLLGVN